MNNINVILESDVTPNSKLELFEFTDEYVLRVDGKPLDARLVARSGFKDMRNFCCAAWYAGKEHGRQTELRNRAAVMFSNAQFDTIELWYSPGLYFFVTRSKSKMIVKLSRQIRNRGLVYECGKRRQKDGCIKWDLSLCNKHKYTEWHEIPSAKSVEDIFESDHTEPEVETKTEKSIEIDNQFLVKTFLDIKTHFESNNMTADSRRNFVALLTKMLD